MKILNQILQKIPQEPALDFSDDQNMNLVLKDGRTLLNISNIGITIPDTVIAEKFFQHPSTLKDTLVPLSQIKDFFDYLSANKVYKRLNHLGICYYVQSIKEEKERLLKEVKKTAFHLYEEISNDEATWLFVGNIKEWKDPLVELILIEKTNDKWKNYWLPHIQIDIDTELDDDEIKTLLLEIFKGVVKPYDLYKVDRFTVITRAWLGVVSGININLDIGFEGRMPRFHRRKMLKKLV